MEKDYTDFIILDNIYQKALASQDIEAFILFSGDGHFSSATSFLKNFYSKEVGIYGIQGSFSRQLQDTASWCVTLPTEESLYGLQYRQIFAALKKSKQIATRKSVIEQVCKAGRNVRKADVESSVKRLIADGYITERRLAAKGGQQADCLFVDWDKVAQSLTEKNKTAFYQACRSPWRQFAAAFGPELKKTAQIARKIQKSYCNCCKNVV